MEISTNPRDLILGQLSQAGEPCPVTPEVVNLLKRRITPESDIKPMEFLFRIFDTPCLPRGELVAVAGKAKSGKTFFLSLLMASFQGKVMWYDTEQSEQSTQDILVNRIMKMKESPPLTPPLKGVGSGCAEIFAFNVRCESWKSRLAKFAVGIAYLQPDLVILDGVRDLISDINDGVEAQRITEQLMTLAQQHHCCIVCVLHQNKSDSDRNLRGWIGTELTNKVFEVYSCEKLKDKRTFKVEQTHTRKFDIVHELYYTVDSETGLPTACSRPVEQPRDAQGRWISSRADGTVAGATYSAAELRRLFTDVLAGRSARPFNEAMALVMRQAQLTEKPQYYDLLRQAEQLGIVRKETATDTGQQYLVLCENELPF